MESSAQFFHSNFAGAKMASKLATGLTVLFLLASALAGGGERVNSKVANLFHWLSTGAHVCECGSALVLKLMPSLCFLGLFLEETFSLTEAQQ